MLYFLQIGPGLKEREKNVPIIQFPAATSLADHFKMLSEDRILGLIIFVSVDPRTIPYSDPGYSQASVRQQLMAVHHKRKV